MLKRRLKYKEEVKLNKVCLAQVSVRYGFISGLIGDHRDFGTHQEKEVSFLKGGVCRKFDGRIQHPAVLNPGIKKKKKKRTVYLSLLIFNNIFYATRILNFNITLVKIKWCANIL